MRRCLVKGKPLTLFSEVTHLIGKKDGQSSYRISLVRLVHRQSRRLSYLGYNTGYQLRTSGTSDSQGLAVSGFDDLVFRS